MSDMEEVGLKNPSDHDILLIIAERTRVTSEHVKDLESRVGMLERDRDRQAGFFAGGKALWGLILSLPAGVVAYLLGVNK